MVTLLLDATRLEIVLSVTERALAFRRDDVRIDREHIRKVQLIDDPWTWLRGVPSPGTHVPRVLAMGIWKSAGGTDLVLVRGRRPAVVIDLQGDVEFQRVLLTTRHGLQLVQALRLEGEEDAVEVGELVTSEIDLPRPAPRRSPGVRTPGMRAPRPATA